MVDKHLILFLDIDGVLCLSNDQIDPFLVPNLAMIIKATNCKVVISSDWKLYPTHRQRVVNTVQSCGGEVIGNTTHDPMPRIEQIKLWVKDNQDIVDKFVAVDDTDLDSQGNPPNWLIQTDWDKGLTHDKAVDTIRFLLDDPDWISPSQKFQKDLDDAKLKGWI